MPSSSTKLITLSSLTMSSLILFLLLSLSLSISSCKARHLSVHVKDLDSSLPHSSKDVEKVDEVQDIAPIEGSKKESISGAGVLIPSSPHGVLPERNQLEVRSGRRVRPLVGTESNGENLGSKEARLMTNLVAMDYASAHRGPSVHNR